MMDEREALARRGALREVLSIVAEHRAFLRSEQERADTERRREDCGIANWSALIIEQRIRALTLRATFAPDAPMEGDG